MAHEWTDGQLDDLSAKVDGGFAQVDQRFERVDQRFEQVDRRFEQVDQRFEQVDQRFEQIDHRFERIESGISALRVETRTEFTELRAEMKAGFARLDGRLDDMNRAMIQAMVTITGGMLAGFGGIIVLIATQL